MEIIHIVLGKANPERMNGVNKVVYQLVTKQTQNSFKVSLWGISKTIDKNYGERNFDTQLFYSQSNPFTFSKELASAIIEKKGKAIFHLHGGWIPVFYSLACFFNKQAIPFVFTPHGAYNTIAMQRSFWVKKLYFTLFENKILKYTSKIHCIGKSEIAGLSRFFKSEKTVLIPYGFENNETVTIQKSQNQEIVFGFIGRLDVYTKGLDILVSAFEKLLVKVPNAKLWIIGDSNEKATLQETINAKNLQNSILLLGSKFGSEKQELLTKMDVFVHPSRNEGLPLSVIEAASFAKPSIVTDATNIGDLITKYNAGISILEPEQELLSDAMFSMYEIWKNDEKFMQIQHNATEMIAETYDWTKVIALFNKELYL